ncbi:unnamed protein product [Linum tenue]|uniref:Uncharacterized protein n=1 Tax=Linum tenue TaxID=586396 RepID=A0AAV0P655_9ROSI|nr:unnamed protein product [Linum tenue]
MLEKVKLLQQRFSELCVLGLHTGSSASFAADRDHVIDLIMKEYITFPILLSNKNFTEMENGVCYIMFRESENPLVQHEKDLDIGTLYAVVEEMQVLQKQNPGDGNSSMACLKSTWTKLADAVKEPYIVSPIQNLLLYFPGCISADISGSRLFFSDTNHHCIIISDGNGSILDCNHAVRRADLERRVLETLYPSSNATVEKESLWTKIASKLGFGIAAVEAKSKEFDPQSLLFPWHLLKSEEEDHCLIINRSFETLWVMDLTTGEIKDVIKGFQKIRDTCGNLITDKLSLLKEMPSDWLEQQAGTYLSSKDTLYATLISSLTTFNGHVFACDTTAQKVVKMNRETRACSMFQLVNYRILGLPYWCSFPLERVYSLSPTHELWTDHLQHFNQLPGRTDVDIKVDIPIDTELVEPLHEGCIWRHARGAAMKSQEQTLNWNLRKRLIVLICCLLSSSHSFGVPFILGLLEVPAFMVCIQVAQKWYDELDNLAFSSAAESETIVEDDDSTIADTENFEDDKVRIHCAVNTSPGLSEVIIYAPLYLRLRRDANVDEEDNQDKHAARIADILKWGSHGLTTRDSCIQLLSRSGKDLRDLVFVKPLHVRIRIECPNHPKAPDNTKDIILTNSTIDVHVSL